MFQLVSMLVYSAVTLRFLLRARAALHHRNSSSPHFASITGPEALNARPMQTLILAVGLASLAIIIRGIYRTAELAQGWNGFAISHEVFTWILDVSCSQLDLLPATGALADLLSHNFMNGLVQAIPMVFCMAFLVPVHPYFGLPNRGRAIAGSASPFADDATMTELRTAGPDAFKQAV